MKNKAFVKIDLDLLAAPTLSATAKLIYARMQLYASKSQDCYASINTLAEGCGISRATACRAITELRGLGLIQIIAATTGSSVHYAIQPYQGGYVKMSQVPMSNCDTHPCQIDTPTHVKMSHNIDNSNKININRGNDDDESDIISEHNLLEKKTQAEHSSMDSVNVPASFNGAASLAVPAKRGEFAPNLTDAVLHDCPAFCTWLYKKFRAATGVRRLYPVNPDRERDGGRFETIERALGECFDPATVETLVEQHLAGFQHDMSAQSAKDYLSMAGFEETVVIAAPVIQVEHRAAQEAAEKVAAEEAERLRQQNMADTKTEILNPAWVRWNNASGAMRNGWDEPEKYLQNGSTGSNG